MTNHRDRDPRFKNLEAKIGVMTIIALAGIAAVFVFLGFERDIFTQKYRITFTTGSGSGFIEWMPVKLSGFKIGRVRKIELTEAAEVRVTVEVNRKYSRWLREGTKARLSKEGMIGDSFVELTVGEASAKQLSDGDAVPFEKSRGIEDIVAEAKPVLEEVKSIIHYVNDPEGDIKKTLANIKEFSSGLIETRKRIDETITEAGGAVKKAGGLVEEMSKSSKKIVKNIEEITLRIEPVLKGAEKITSDAGRAAERLPSLIENVEKITLDVKGLTGALSKEAPKISALVGEAKEAAKEGREILKAVRGSWPVRLMAPSKRAPELVPLDSYLFEKTKAADDR